MLVARMALLAVTFTACLPAADAPAASPSPAEATASPTVAASPSPTVSPASSPGIRVTAVSALPADPHFFMLGVPDAGRIMLFDATATRPPFEVVRFDAEPAPSGSSGGIAFGASADGRVLVIARRVSDQRTVHYLVRPQTGEVVLLLTDLASSFGTPVVSPDGTRYAYARLGDRAGTGVFVADARAGPDPKRIVASDPQIAGSPPQPVAWSADGAWLAVTISNAGGSRIGVVRTQAGEATLDVLGGTFTGGDARMLGPGHDIDWRGGDQNLLVTSARNAFGGRSVVYATTVAGGQPRELYVPGGDVRLAGARWHPALDRFVVHETLCCGANLPATTWLRKADGTGTRIYDGPAIGPPWWSKDGTRLWAEGIGDDSVSGFRDLLSSTTVPFCRRSPAPPCA